MNFKQRVGHHIIKVARKLFAGTAVHNWRITNYIYKTVFNSMYTDQVTKTKFRGLDFMIPTNDITLAPSVLSGTFEEKELGIFESLCEKNQIILDVGANIGLYTAIAAKKVGPKGKVYAFEPVPENLKYLTQNVRNNKFEDRVEIVDKAVGEKRGLLEIFIQENQIGTHSAVQVGRSHKSVKVPMCSIDSFTKDKKLKNVDIIKVDVEGYDGNVLRGAIETLKKFKPALLIEYSPQLLTRSDFTTKNFQNSLFEIYRNCYLVDEFKGKIYHIDQKGLSAVRIATNVNLVLSDDLKIISKIKKIGAIENIALTDSQRLVLST